MAKVEDLFDSVEGLFDDVEETAPDNNLKARLGAQTKASLGQLEAEQMAETPEAKANRAVDEGYAPGPVTTAALYGLNSLTAGTLPYLADYIFPAEEGATQPWLQDMMDAGAAANPRIAGAAEAAPALIGAAGGLARAGAQRLGLGAGRELIKQAPEAATRAMAAKRALGNLARTSTAGGTVGALEGATSSRPSEEGNLTEQAVRGGAAGFGLGAAGSTAATLIKNRANLGPALQEGWQTAVEGLKNAPTMTGGAIRAAGGAKAAGSRLFQPQYTQSKMPLGPQEPPSIEAFMSESRPSRSVRSPRPPVEAPEADPQMTLQHTSLGEEGMLSKLPQESMQELLQGPMQSRSIPTPARIEQAPQTTTLGQSELVPTPDGPMTLDQLFNEPKYRDLVENLWPRIQPDDVSTAGMQSQVSRSMQQPTVAPPRAETVQQRPPAAPLGLEELQAELAPVSRSTPSIFKTTGEMPPGMSLADLPNLLDPGTPAQKALQLVTEFGVTNEAALSRLSGLSPQEAKALVTQLRTGVSPR